jgi:hypothetical protein
MHRSRIRRAGRGSALLAALALLAVPLSAARADTGAPTGVLTGVVTVAGRPVSGAIVTVTALPGLEAPTGPYRQQPMASGTTSATGRFSVPLTVSKTIVDLASVNSGYVNYWVQAFYNDAAASDPGTIVWGGEGKVYTAADLAYSTLIDTGLADPVTGAAATVLSAPDTVTLELTAYEGADTVKMTSSGLAGDALYAACSSSVSAGDSACGSAGEGSSCESRYAPWVTILGRENDMEPVGEAHVMYDSTGNFSYGKTANTDLSGAYSASGGPFKGTASMNHIGNTESKIVKAYTAHQAYELLTQFRYRKERLEFTDDGGDGHVCRTDYRVIPEGWVGGYTFGTDVSSHDSAGQMDAARGKGWATLFDGTGQFVKNTSKGQKYSADVSAFGIKLAAQSTWSDKVEVHWTFGSDDEHWLYGSNGTIKSAENIYAW